MRIILLLVVSVFIIYSTIILAQGSGPEAVNLKEKYAPGGSMRAVIFPHWTHQGFLGCDSCHIIDDMSLKNQNDNATLLLKGTPLGVFHNKFCWSCHKKMGASIECSKCHIKIGGK
jgi:hypothetical protein